jgi:hypothetical protein
MQSPMPRPTRQSRRLRTESRRVLTSARRTVAGRAAIVIGMSPSVRDGQRGDATAAAIITTIGAILVAIIGLYGSLVIAGKVTPPWSHHASAESPPTSTSPTPSSTQAALPPVPQPSSAPSVPALPTASGPSPTAAALTSPAQLPEYLPDSPCQGGVIQLAAELEGGATPMVQAVLDHLRAGETIASRIDLTAPHVGSGSTCGVDGWIIYFGPFQPQDPIKEWCDQVGETLKASPDLQPLFTDGTGQLRLPYFREASGKRHANAAGGLYFCGS